MPWRTLAGLASEPGMLSRVGAVTAQVTRDLAAAAALERRCEWRLILVGHAGTSLAVSSVPRTWLIQRGRAAAGSAQPAGEPYAANIAPGAAGLVARITLTLPIAEVDRLPESDAASWTCPPELRAVLAAALRAGVRAAGQFRAIQAQSVSSGVCSHHSEVPGYRVPGSLRAFVEARDQTCRFPGCRQPAWRCDQDHTLAYESGGRTCACNLSAACRHHHRLKQLHDWLLAQPRPGQLTWRTPAGLIYAVTPEPHPC